MSAAKCNCPKAGAGKERECFAVWWGMAIGRCACKCHKRQRLQAQQEAKLLCDAIVRKRKR